MTYSFLWHILGSAIGTIIATTSTPAVITPRISTATTSNPTATTITISSTAPGQACNLTSAPITTYTLGNGSNPKKHTAGEFDQDGILDIVVVNVGFNIILALGNGAYATPINFTTGSGPESVFVADVNNGNRLDVIVANYYRNSVSELLGFGGGRFTAQTAFITSSYPIAVVVVDFNAHNRLDLAVINLIGQTISILLGYENGSFGQQTT
ncbi:unnamed protein product [Rotaria socialis]|uniref:VCBS repeat-containing protein n=1 Tax=Rotaria socialis TaxID=392032 RepID=A0A820ES58_9BILA|nr:unnamed protein product [Rotaria socialis]